jgi:hypothetical protein
MATCPLLYRKNHVAPEPNELDGSAHGTAGAQLYDIEFGGFTRKLTRETAFPLGAGTFTVKIVIQDVADRRLDSALFVETDSLKLFSLRQGDYNGNGVVDAADYVIWRDNRNLTNAHFYQGDGNGDGVVNNADYSLWVANFGLTGNKDFCSDFNRDGLVNDDDLIVMAPYYEQLGECASRFEGDADGDGAVNDCDLSIWGYEQQSGIPAEPCACAQQFAGGGEMMMALNGTELADLKGEIPDSADMDGDGDVDDNDIAQLDAIIYNAFAKMKSLKDAAAEYAPEPTLVDPVQPAPQNFPPALPIPPSARR